LFILKDEILGRRGEGLAWFTSWVKKLLDGKVTEFPSPPFDSADYKNARQSLYNALLFTKKLEQKYSQATHDVVGPSEESKLSILAEELSSLLIRSLPLKNLSKLSKDIERFSGELISAEQFIVQLKKICGVHVSAYLPVLNYLGIETGTNEKVESELRVKLKRYSANVDLLSQELEKLILNTTPISKKKDSISNKKTNFGYCHRLEFRCLYLPRSHHSFLSHAISTSQRVIMLTGLNASTTEE